MDKDLHNIEDLFRSSLDDNEEIPSKNVWKGVEQVLDKDNISTIKKNYNNLKRLAAVLVLLLAGLSFYDFYSIFMGKKITKENAGIIRDIAKSKDGKSHSNIIIPGNAVSPSRDTNTISSSANEFFKFPQSDFHIAKERSISKNIMESSQGNRSKHKRPYVSGSKLNMLLNRSNVIAKAKYKIRIQNKMSSLSKANSINNLIANKPSGQVTSYLGNHPELKNGRLNDEQVIIQNEPLVSKIRSSLNPAGKIDISLETQKLQHSIILKSNLNINNSLSLSKDVQKQGKPRVSKFSTALFFSPDFAWYRLQDDVPDNQSMDADDIERSEKHEFSCSVGALMDYTLSRHWYIESGLMFSNTVITLEPKIIYAQADNSGFIKYRFNSSSGYSYVLPAFSNSPNIGDSLYAFTSIHTLQYVGIPIAIKYNFAKRKLDFNSVIGLSPNFLTKGKIETVLEKGTFNGSEIFTNIEGLKSVYFSGLIGVSAAYSLTKNIALTFTPIARFALSSINKGAVVKSYPNSFGLSTAILIKL